MLFAAEVRVEAAGLTNVLLRRQERWNANAAYAANAPACAGAREISDEIRLCLFDGKPAQRFFLNLSC